MIMGRLRMLHGLENYVCNLRCSVWYTGAAQMNSFWGGHVWEAHSYPVLIAGGIVLCL